MAVRPKLCSLCLKLECEFFRPPKPVDLEQDISQYSRHDRDDREFLHQPSYTALLNSISEGCNLCSLIQFALIDAHIQARFVNVPKDSIEAHLYEQEHKFPEFAFIKFFMPEQTLLEAISSSTRGYCTIHFGCPGIGPSEIPWMTCPLRITFILGVEADSLALHDGRIFGREITTAPNLGVGLYWLRQCLSNHQSCRDRPIEKPPTRLIDICSGERPNELLLVETEAQHVYQYTTLSYRWGKKSGFVTTKENYSNRLIGFALDELPLTLQQAVVVTRRLGIQYLWIDAICIIQESTDWEIECPKMASIYGGSVVTIAAESAPDVTTGFLDLRNAEDLNKPLVCELQYRGSDGTSTGLVKMMYPRFRHYGELHASEMASVIRTRGWVLQERVLPFRILHFGSRQMYWSCEEREWFESIHWSLPGASARQVKMFTQSSISREMFKWWNDLLYEYTTCDLTYQTDKLPAISGIAATFQKVTKSRYIAGMWEDDLPRSLIWSRQAAVVNNGAPPNKPPSWSWASCDHPIQFFDTPYKENKYHSTLTFIHVSAPPIGADPFGQVSSGIMRVGGRLKTGLIGRFDFEPDRLLLCDIVLNEYKALALFEPDDPDFHSISLPTLDRSVNGDDKVLNVICLQIGYRAYSKYRCAWALALKFRPETQQYRRIGLLSPLRRVLHKSTDLPNVDMKGFGMWFDECKNRWLSWFRSIELLIHMGNIPRWEDAPDFGEYRGD